MRKLLWGKMLMAGSFLLLSLASGASADETVTTNHNYIKVANDLGVKYYDWDYQYYSGKIEGTYPGAGPNTYLIKANGGGLNELRITDGTKIIGVITGGNVTAIDTTSNNPSGTFYVTNNGGRGYDNDIIIALSVTGPISENFSVNIKSGGYTWTPIGRGVMSPPTDYSYITGVNETFKKSDFTYGPQLLRPGTSNFQTGLGSLPLYVGQDTADQSTAQYLMFIDLYVGNISPSNLAGLTDDGAAKVDFQIKGLDAATKIAFNAYGWVSGSNQDEGINWSNNTGAPSGAPNGTPAGLNGYSINVTPIDTTYPTAAISYSPAGPYKPGTVVTITATFSEAMADLPVPMISLSGAATLGPANMTKVDATHYTYSYTTGSGSGEVAVALSTGTDLDGNVLRPTPASGGTFALDDTPPTVSSFSPDGTAFVGIDSAVTATFSEPMDPQTITSSTFQVNEVVGGAVNGTVTYDAASRTATLIPTTPLAKSKTYDVTVSGVKDLVGNLLSTPVNWTFTTSADPDAREPSAAISYAPAGPFRAGTLVTITATFSEAMATPIPWIALSGVAPMAAAEMTYVDINHYSYSYTVGSGDGEVTVTLSHAIDLAGNDVVTTPSAGGSFTIDNTPPEVSSFTPLHGALSVEVDSPVTVKFSEAVDPQTITAATFHMDRASGERVTGTVTYDAASRMATIIPEQLATGTPYNVTVSGVKDQAGNLLSSPVIWTFTTAGTPDMTPPSAVVSYSPAGPFRAGDVVAITATFSEAMASSTPLSIALSGAASLGATDMTRVDTNHYRYVYTAGPGDGAVTVTLANATDFAGHHVVSTPTEGGTFTLDNTGPTALSISPADGTSLIPVNSSISASFSEALDVFTLDSSTFSVSGVAGTVTYDAASSTATFKPLKALSYATTYTATLTTGIKDTTGNPMTVEKTWTFSTTPLYGDLKGTGQAMTIQDALIALQIAAGIVTPTTQQLLVGDVAPLVNGQPHPDGKIDISDVVVILMKVVGLLNW